MQIQLEAGPELEPKYTIKKEEIKPDNADTSLLEILEIKSL